MACLGAIEKLGWPLDRIVHAEIWATDTISADLPPMVEFKKKADAIIKERYGIEVEHIYAVRGGERDTYEKRFYAELTRGKFVGTIKGFPLTRAGWCKALKYGSQVDLRKHILSDDEEAPENGRATGFTGSRCGKGTGATPTSRLQHSADYGVCKQVPSVLHRGTQVVHPVPPAFSDSPVSEGADTNTLVQYLGIAADEPKRLARLDGINKISPLAAIGWTEADCWKWCEEND